MIFCDLCGALNVYKSILRLPKAFQFDVDEVEILRRADEILLRKKRKDLREAYDILTSMPEDFFAEGREEQEEVTNF